MSPRNRARLVEARDDAAELTRIRARVKRQRGLLAPWQAEALLSLRKLRCNNGDYVQGRFEPSTVMSPEPV